MSFEVDDIVQIDSKDQADIGVGPATKTTVILTAVSSKKKSFSCKTLHFSGYKNSESKSWTFSWGEDYGFNVYKVGTKQENPEYFL